MEKVCRFNGFQKLMLFFVPLILTGSGHYLTSQIFVSIPWILNVIIGFLFLFLMFVCWAWLVISFQIHWKRETRNIIANVSVLGIAVICLVLEFTF